MKWEITAIPVSPTATGTCIQSPSSSENAEVDYQVDHQVNYRSIKLLD